MTTPQLFATLHVHVIALACLLLTVTAEGAESLSQRASAYRAELVNFRLEYGGVRALPDAEFFLFGMGLRSKWLYQTGALMNARSGEVVRRWSVDEAVILPADYSVNLRTSDGLAVRIFEDEGGVFIDEGKRELLPGTTAPVRLPDFRAFKYPAVMRVLHQEVLVNVTTNGPVPNFFVYEKPWYRDAAMMALVFKETGNLDCIRDWVLGLREVFDRNNAGETEADNPGQVLFLISLVSDRNHPLVPKVLAAAARFETNGPDGKYLLGRSDFAAHPGYQTKWMKFGLRALGLPDPYTVPRLADGYSALFWMDYRDTYVAGKDADDRGHYSYLGWACDHFHGVKKSPISNRDYPLTWESQASQANYDGIKLLSPIYARNKIAAPHTWHAAEVFLYLWNLKK